MTTNRVRTGLRIPYEQNTALILLAKKLGISKNALILQAIKDYMATTNNHNEKVR